MAVVVEQLAYLPVTLLPILIYQGVHCCTQSLQLHYITDLQGSDTTWELRMAST